MTKSMSPRVPLLESQHDKPQDIGFKYTSLLAFMIGSVGDQVSFKRITYAANFPSALTQLTALVGAVVYPLVVGVALAMGLVKSSQLCLPLWKPAVIAVLFVLHHMLLNAGAGGATVPGIIVGVLVKMVIPFSMLLNMPKTSLGLKYSALHWFSFALVMAGIAVTVNLGSFPLTGAAAGKMILIVLSTIPLAGAFTFIEVNLTHRHPDLFAVALWMWVCLFMSLVSLVFLPLSAWLNGVPATDMLPDLRRGMVCYVEGVAPLDAKHDLDCEEASRFWWTNICFAFLMNVGMPLSTRYGGATLMWFVRALTVPLAGVCFAQPSVMGKHAVPMSRSQEVGLLVVTLGVLLFNASEPTTSD